MRRSRPLASRGENKKEGGWYALKMVSNRSRPLASRGFDSDDVDLVLFHAFPIDRVP